MFTAVLPEIECRENPFQNPAPAPPEGSGLYRVVIIDNNHNTYQQVIEICMEALGIGFDQAYHIALAVDNNGMADVMHAPRPQAEKTASVIRSIGIEVRVEQIS